MKSYLGEDALYNFLSGMIGENKYCSDVMKKHFNKELLLNRENNEDLENSTNVGFLIMSIMILMLK